AEALSRGLVSVQDLPAGWRLSQDSGGSPEDTDLCGANLAAIEHQRQKLGEAASSFERGGSGPYLVQTLAAYPSGVAEQVMSDLAAAIASCRQATIRDEEGSLSTWELAPIPFPQLGDQTIAFREYLPTNDVEAVIVYIRRGDRITVLLSIAIRAHVDLIQTEAFA